MNVQTSRFAPPMPHEEPTPQRPRWSHHRHPEYRVCEVVECRDEAECVYESRSGRWFCPDCADAMDEETGQ